MSQAQLSDRFQSFATSPQYPSDAALSTVVYRSRAAKSFSYTDLQDLAHAAQSRNHAESITGLMVYDAPYFYQWLEGPPENVTRIVDSIRSDPRHGEIEIVSQQPADARLFSGWDMKLATRSVQNGPWQQEVIYPRLETMHQLRRHPEDAAALLAAFAPGGPARPVRSNSSPATLLENLIQTRVIPELVARQRVIAPLPLPDHRVLQLADLLLASDSSAALDMIHENFGEGLSALPLYATLLEPTARRLGDLSQSDFCSELELTIALSHLQSAVRLLGAEALPPLITSAPTPSVLVVPLPGELHGLGAALDSEAMWQKGWAPQNEFPTDDAALQKLLTGHWFDVLDLTLSVALRREHWLPRMAETIRLARRASLNPALVIVVGGRVFAEHVADAGEVTADSASQTATGITTDILNKLPRGHK